MEIFFATTNLGKLGEATKILKEIGIKVKHFPFVYNEIRSDSIEEVARDAVKFAYKRLKEPVFVEDTGLFIEKWNGFPGTYSAVMLKKLGNEGIIKLMEGEPNRAALFDTCIAYHDTNGTTVAHGKCYGRISESIRGKSGFGFDSIFIPDGGEQTFAESIELKNKLSHRYKSLLEFSKSLKLRR
ncbi:XTP/dITP diphosphatase [Candidatus Micrarchaeota archaeon]|nr:XTP/dITP diphosphatase [Candidatus Micrarchaeota archaeon]MBU1165514.1 XTP/dITP diphosphatase [Candidatus Micrarchaeota archaeon]MBU1887412.1 XTP/dITP diphosphatase [Candidatus Micrarchaeota archaeon]